MRRFVFACLSLAAIRSVANAQEAAPEIPFTANVDLLKLPAGAYLGEVAGVAVNSKRHIFVFSRTGVRSTLHGASASQLFEFGPDGTFIREIGQNLYGFAFAHTVRIDKDDNIWDRRRVEHDHQVQPCRQSAHGAGPP